MVILVADLDQVAAARLEDAKALLAVSRYDSAVYMCGYAVELALKARICRALNWSEFPETRKEFEGDASFRTHDLQVPLRLSGQEANIKNGHPRSWQALADWSPEIRYTVAGSITRSEAEGMVNSADTLVRVI